MPTLGFRLRLGLLFVATLTIVQVTTAVLVYGVTRSHIIQDGERQLQINADVFSRQLDDLTRRISESVQVLSLDYALRSAIAENDQDTVISALRNHGHRVGASRMLLIDLEGNIEVDTAAAAIFEDRKPFPFAALVSNALEGPSADIVALDGHAYWMVVVPINAPQPIALIAAGIPVDDALLERMEKTSALPNEIELVSESAPNHWSALAKGSIYVDLLGAITRRSLGLPNQPALMGIKGHEFIVLSRRLDRQLSGPSVYALMGYSVDDALSNYRSIGLIWLALLSLGLMAALIAALVIARSVSRPVEVLARIARRIERGDYSPFPNMMAKDEFGELEVAFSHMQLAIQEREALIRHQLHHDAVTDLLQRAAGESAIQSRLNEKPQASGAVMMIGLTRLNDVIKTMGHAVGDRLMRSVSLRFAALPSEVLIARASDTQFLLWVSLETQALVLQLARDIMDFLSEPYRDTDLNIDLGAAIGISHYPEHGGQASILLQHSEVALFHALKGAKEIEVYDSAADAYRPERLSLMSELKAALAENQVNLAYQPKVRLTDHVIDGAEALIRWQHPQRGFIPPDHFIELAEETGKIRLITHWALETAGCQLQSWSSQGRSLKVAINLSARDLSDAQFPNHVSHLIGLKHISPAQITLEVTESAVLSDPEAAVRMLNELAAMGMWIALDDFGAGQASFSYLRRLPVHELKIDKSFVQELSYSATDRIIVGAIIELGHRLGYTVTAEGVENLATYQTLVELGCDQAQGFFISRALPAGEFERFVDENRWSYRN